MNDIASADTAAIVDGNVRINTSVFAENNAFADNAVGSDKAVRPDLRTFANYNAGFNGCGRINNGTVFDYGSGINPRLRLLLREDDLQGICKPSVRIAGNDDDTFGLFFLPKSPVCLLLSKPKLSLCRRQPHHDICCWLKKHVAVPGGLQRSNGLNFSLASVGTDCAQ